MVFSQVVKCFRDGPYLLRHLVICELHDSGIARPTCGPQLSGVKGEVLEELKQARRAAKVWKDWDTALMER